MLKALVDIERKIRELKKKRNAVIPGDVYFIDKFIEYVQGRNDLKELFMKESRKQY